MLHFPIEDHSILDFHNPPDAYFNNLPVRLRDAKTSFNSNVHCVGETHDPDTAWKHRSCSYVHLCLDMAGDSKAPEFFLVASNSESEFHKRFRDDGAQSGHAQHRFSSTEMKDITNYQNSTTIKSSPIDVALGGINPNWKAPPKPRVPYQHGIDKIKWAPKIYNKFPSEKYYELDPNIVMIPFHSFAAANVGHLLWDDFLPIYNLLRIFGYEKNAHTTQSTAIADDKEHYVSHFQHLLIRVDTLPSLFGTCDLRPKRKEACKHNLERFLPLFGVDPDTLSTLTETKLTQSKGTDTSKRPSVPKTYPVCAKHGVAGLGWLTDHGMRNHGWMAKNEENSLDIALAQNVGRGPELYAFRNFLLRNLGMETRHELPRLGIPHNIHFRILLSAHSSNHPDRSFGLLAQKTALAKAFPQADIAILELSKISLLEQIALISDQPSKESGNNLRSSSSYNIRNRQHTIFISACGGGSFTSYFLPRGSSLIFYYNEAGGMDYFNNEQKTGGPALLDWDLMNNLGYLRVHWLPIGAMDEEEGLNALVALVQHEMDGVLNEFG